MCRDGHRGRGSLRRSAPRLAGGRPRVLRSRRAVGQRGPARRAGGDREDDLHRGRGDLGEQVQLRGGERLVGGDHEEQRTGTAHRFEQHPVAGHAERGGVRNVDQGEVPQQQLGHAQLDPPGRTGQRRTGSVPVRAVRVRLTVTGHERRPGGHLGVAHHQPAARRHGEHHRVELEQGGEHGAPLGTGRADGDHAERLLRCGTGDADPRGQRPQLGRSVGPVMSSGKSTEGRGPCFHQVPPVAGDRLPGRVNIPVEQPRMSKTRASRRPGGTPPILTGNCAATQLRR